MSILGYVWFSGMRRRRKRNEKGREREKSGGKKVIPCVWIERRRKRKEVRYFTLLLF